MLSIGKLASGQADYYLEQAGGRVDRSLSVSSGVEDYYSDGGDSDGVWMGAGTAALKLAGGVDGAALRRLLEGANPSTGDPLGRHAAARVPGFDVTFSAPKSVSVLFGIGDERLRAMIRRAHEAAVRDAFAYLEREAAVARRGAAGAFSVRGRGFVAAAFRHRTSRARDPQLHTHVLIANLVQAEDGRWSALDGRRLYAHGKTAGYLYEARLRAELTRELGVAWTPVRNGIADIDGVPANVLRAFSRRRAQIEAELEARGTTGARAAQAAALDTRRRKDHAVDPARLESTWRERARELGFGREQIESLVGRDAPSLDGELLGSVARELAGERGLTHHRSSFTRRDAVQAWCALLPAGAPVDVALLERLADHFLASPDAVPLAVGDATSSRDAVLRRQDGRLVRALPDERRYSTPALLLQERRLLDRARNGVASGRGLASAEAVGAAVAGRPTLSDEQAAMVARLTRDGDAFAVVVGQAGAGKTFALATAREAWEASGVPVVGAAVAWRAARALEREAGIASTSLAALLERSRSHALPRRCVVVLDEAAMVGTRQLVELSERVRRADGKLVLVGDHHQLPEIDAGGAFRALRRLLPMIELKENRRQAEAWERDALAQLRDGQGLDALPAYAAHGRIKTGGGEEIRARLVADWAAIGDPDRAVMIAFRRSDVDDLNARARSLRRDAGLLSGDELEIDGCRFAAGDHVVLRRNDRHRGIVNGDRGIVTRAHPSSLSLTIAIDGRDVRLTRDYLRSVGERASLQHGYAVTGHVMQGSTVDRTFVLATEDIGREWLYTAMSRGRLANQLYVTSLPRERDQFAPAEPRRDAAEVLALAVERSSAQHLAVETRQRSRSFGIER